MGKWSISPLGPLWRFPFQLASIGIFLGGMLSGDRDTMLAAFAFGGFFSGLAFAAVLNNT